MFEGWRIKRKFQQWKCGKETRERFSIHMANLQGVNLQWHLMFHDHTTQSSISSLLPTPNNHFQRLRIQTCSSFKLFCVDCPRFLVVLVLTFASVQPQTNFQLTIPNANLRWPGESHGLVSKNWTTCLRASCKQSYTCSLHATISMNASVTAPQAQAIR